MHVILRRPILTSIFLIASNYSKNSAKTKAEQNFYAWINAD